MRADDSAGQAEARSCWPLQAMVRNLDFILSKMGRGALGPQIHFKQGHSKFSCRRHVENNPSWISQVRGAC